tara:strand:+ start:126 stop:335 length:210 start_codon:yes stop_codon:yes gene_type:complete
MNDFKKGLLVGALLIIGCVSFMASDDNNDVGRFVPINTTDKLVSASGLILDTKTGDVYMAGKIRHKRER